MATRKRNKKNVKPWYMDSSIVTEFEREAVKEYPSLESSNRIVGSRRWRQYSLIIDLEEYEARQVKIKFEQDSRMPPRVTVDGPDESPHRYKGGVLCMWQPKDPVENRWVFEDGLLELLVIIGFHLYREALWRETGEWYGPEASH